MIPGKLTFCKMVQNLNSYSVLSHWSLWTDKLFSKKNVRRENPSTISHQHIVTKYKAYICSIQDVHNISCSRWEEKEDGEFYSDRISHQNQKWYVTTCCKEYQRYFLNYLWHLAPRKISSWTFSFFLVIFFVRKVGLHFCHVFASMV